VGRQPDLGLAEPEVRERRGAIDVFEQRIWREKIACSDRFAAIVNRATIWTAQGFMRGAAPERM
jgi:hypothetical protein